MNFLFPLGFWALGLLPVVVVFYLVRVRPERREVSSLLWWQMALNESPSRRFLGKIRHWLSLLCQLLILALIILALVRPVVGGKLPAGPVLLVLDNRAAMQAVVEDSTPADQIRSEAGRLLASWPPGVPVALWSLDSQLRLLSGFSSDTYQARRALEAWSVTDTTSDAAEEMERLVVLAEGLGSEADRWFLGRPDGTRPLPSAWRVSPFLVEGDNSGITAAGGLPVSGARPGLQLFAAVSHFGFETLRSTVEFYLNGELAGVRAVEVPPGATRPVEMLLNREGNGVAEVRMELNHADSLSSDNSAWLVFPEVKPVRVLLVSSGNFFLERLLASNPRVAFELLLPEAWRSEISRSFDVTVFDRELPEAMTAVDFPSIFLVRHPWLPQTDLAPSAVATESAGHALLANASLRDVLLAEAADWSGLESANPGGWVLRNPVVSPDGPLVVTGESSSQPGARWVGLAFDVTRSDLPMRRAFPLLFDNILGWLTPGAALPATAPRPGEFLAEGIAAPLLAGFHEVLSPQAEPFPIGLSVASARESNLNPVAGEGEARAILASPGAPAALWQGLALGALILLLVEWRALRPEKLRNKPSLL